MPKEVAKILKEAVEKGELFLKNPNFQEEIFPLKIFFILVGFLFLFGFIYFFIRSSFFRAYFFQDWLEFISWRSEGFLKTKKRWEKIKKRLSSPSSSDWKVSLIEAQQLLEDCLRKSGYQGKTFEEMVIKIDPEIFPEKEKLLKIYQIYQAITADPDYFLDLAEAKEFLKIVEKALVNLNYL